MPSHFSTIGLPIQEQEDLLSLAERVMVSSSSIRVANGSYLHWTSPSGAELWLQVDNHNHLIGINPHFADQARILVDLTARISRPEESALDGAFHGWANPINSNPDSGNYPFVFDVPDFKQHAKLALHVTVNAQVAAFAHDVSIHPSEDDFHNSQTTEVKFAAQSFLPSGLFSRGENSNAPPESMAIFTGIVHWATLAITELTNKEFWWVLVDLLGGSFDVVIDPELVDERPQVGGVLSGSFWLSGRLITE